MKVLDDYSFTPGGQDIKNMVIFLHGYGADGKDLISIAPLWAESMPNTVFFAPNAPEPCEMSPSGFQWFSLADRSPDRMKAGAANVDKVLKTYIQAKLEANDLAIDNLAIVGFSQGTMMALYTMPQLKHACAGVLGYSGRALITPDDSSVKFPICAIHGTADEIVPFDSLKHLEDSFTKWPDVKTHARPNLGHGIDQQGLQIGAKFLKDCLYS